MTSIGKSVIPLVLALLGLGCTSDPSAGVSAEGAALSRRRPPTPVVFDTDMDFDDAAALALLCQEHLRGHIDLRAVTIENDGAGTPGSAIRHARCVLAACGAPHIPVADGSPVGVHATAPELRGAVEAVLEGALASCTESAAPAPIDAPSLLRATIDDDHDGVVLLTTGPLTNVASALEGCRGDEVADGIDRVVIMGGAFGVPGNLLGTGTESFDGTQELNVWVDPPALASVLSRLSDRTEIVPLDATADVPVTADFLARLSAEGTTPSAAVVSSIGAQPIVQFGVAFHLFYWWDPLAATVALGRADVVDSDRVRVGVITAEGPSSGRTFVTRRGPRARVAMHADAAAFEDAFVAGLDGTD